MTDFIAAALVQGKLGLAPHYPFLHASVVGTHAQRTFEFGTGGSTRVFLEALALTGGVHRSVSLEPREAIAAQWGVIDSPSWGHTCLRSQDFVRNPALRPEFLDIVLHDGAHTTDAVAQDVAWIWPALKRFGLLLVHDTQHARIGWEVRQGLRRGLLTVTADFTATTLPYGLGLTVIRKESGDHPIEPMKSQDPENLTDLMTFDLLY